MKLRLRFTRQGRADVKREAAWWRKNRRAAASLFQQELDATLRRVLLSPKIGLVFEQEDLEVTVYRIGLPRTRTQLFYALNGEELVVISVWGATKGEAPKLKRFPR